MKTTFSFKQMDKIMKNNDFWQVMKMTTIKCIIAANPKANDLEILLLLESYKFEVHYDNEYRPTDIFCI